MAKKKKTRKGTSKSQKRTRKKAAARKKASTRKKVAARKKAAAKNSAAKKKDAATNETPPDNVVDFRIPDRRAVEGTMFGGFGARESGPIEMAQELMYQAWDAGSRKTRISLARQALKVSPHCADAWVLLAEEEARSLKQATEMYRKGVEAGERALGKQAFTRDAGHFWGILETRPYMRARAGLAQCLWATGKREQAVDHYQDMLRLNPNDNQGLRDGLAIWLLELGRNDEAAKLLKKYDGDPSAAWAYNSALVAFRKRGDDRNARKRLAHALKTNPHVPGFLLGRERLPRQLPEYIGFGDRNEAVAYAVDGIPAWRATPEALEWLAGHADG